MSIDPRPNSLILSRGTILDCRWDSVIPGATAAALQFYDADRAVIATINATVTGDVLAFLHTDVASLDAIPAGTPYELIVTAAGNPYTQLYGVVVRREACAYGDTVRAIT